MHKADLLLMLGTDFPYSEFLPVKGAIIQINTNPERLGHRGKVDYGYCGDIRFTIRELLLMVKARSKADFLDGMRSMHKDIEEKYDS